MRYALIFCLLIACGGAGAEATTTEVTMVSSTTTTTTIPPTTTTTLSEEELARIEYEADVVLIKALYRDRSDSWFDGIEAGVAYLVAHNHPDATCTADQFLADLRDSGAGEGYQEEIVLDVDTIERDDGWTFPPTGEVPEGRIYIHRMTFTASEPGFEPRSEVIESHSAILHGQAYFFSGLVDC